MYLKKSTGLLMLCLFLGCSIFNKNKNLASSETPKDKLIEHTVVADTTIIPDSTALVSLDSVAPPPPPKLPLEYMTVEEKAMIEEINLLRADPNAYIQHVDAYLQDFMEDPNWDFNTKQTERSAGEELIRALRYMPPLELLLPSEELYKVAMQHGQDMKEHNSINHRGSDDSLPEDRIRDSTTLIGRENLAAGGRSVRESVIMLLVDASDRANRSHRKTILDPAWRYTACYYAGTVSEIPGTWVQLFGLKDPDDIPVELPVRAVPTKETEEAKATEETEPGEDVVAEGGNDFMSAEEYSMVKEINLMRANPKAYIQHVDAYIAEMKQMMVGDDPDFDKASNELKSLFRTMPALSQLKPHRKLYEVTKAHGLDNKQQHQLEHKGSDNRQSFDRVKDSGLKNSISNNGVYAPNENLVGGESTVRNAVIALLIDAGISTRGHRKALIEPTWEYVACYKIGTIEDLKDLQGMGLEDDDMANCWVQMFAID